MKRVLCCIMLSIMLLCACSNRTGEDMDHKDQITENKTEDNNQDPNIGMGLFLNMYKVNKGKENNEIKYGAFLEDVINYDGEKIELGIDMSIEASGSRDELIEAMVMMLVDEQLIPFTIDGSSESIIHKITLEDSEVSRKLVGFYPSNLDKGEEKEWIFLLIPVFEEYAHVPDEIMAIGYNKKIISNVDKTYVNESDFCDKNYFYDTAKNVYGKEIHEICEYNGAVNDYIIQDNNKWYYMSDSHYGGKIMVMLLCEGELYEGFDGKFGLSIEKTVEGQQVHMEIDTSKLGEGKQHMSAIVLAYDADGELRRVNKALMVELNDEK